MSHGTGGTRRWGPAARSRNRAERGSRHGSGSSSRQGRLRAGRLPTRPRRLASGTGTGPRGAGGARAPAGRPPPACRAAPAPGRGGAGGARALRTDRTERAGQLGATQLRAASAWRLPTRQGSPRLRTARTGAALSVPVGSPAAKFPLHLRNSPGARSAPTHDIWCRGTGRSTLKCGGTPRFKPFKYWKNWSFLKLNPWN